MSSVNALMAYEGTLSNGIKYQIHQSSGFSNKCDIAINIVGEFVSVLTVAPKRNGSIEIIPMSNGRMTISFKDQKKENVEPEVKKTEDSPDLFSGIAPIYPKSISEPNPTEE